MQSAALIPPGSGDVCPEFQSQSASFDCMLFRVQKMDSSDYFIIFSRLIISHSVWITVDLKFVKFWLSFNKFNKQFMQILCKICNKTIPCSDPSDAAVMFLLSDLVLLITIYVYGKVIIISVGSVCLFFFKL